MPRLDGSDRFRQTPRARLHGRAQKTAHGVYRLTQDAALKHQNLAVTEAQDPRACPMPGRMGCCSRYLDRRPHICGSLVSARSNGWSRCSLDGHVCTRMYIAAMSNSRAGCFGGLGRGCRRCDGHVCCGCVGWTQTLVENHRLQVPEAHIPHIELVKGGRRGEARSAYFRAS